MPPMPRGDAWPPSLALQLCVAVRKRGDVEPAPREVIEAVGRRGGVGTPRPEALLLPCGGVRRCGTSQLPPAFAPLPLLTMAALGVKRAQLPEPLLCGGVGALWALAARSLLRGWVKADLGEVASARAPSAGRRDMAGVATVCCLASAAGEKFPPVNAECGGSAVW